MADAFSFADDLGTLKVIHVNVPKFAVKGILVVDNVAAAAAKLLKTQTGVRA